MSPRVVDIAYKAFMTALVCFLLVGIAQLFQGPSARAEDVTIAPVASPSTAPVGSPMLFFTRARDGGVASCDSCSTPMSVPLPSAEDPDGFLTGVSIFPCFNCGETHAIGQLNIRKASGGSFPTGTWLEWVWDRQTRSWRRR